MAASCKRITTYSKQQTQAARFIGKYAKVSYSSHPLVARQQRCSPQTQFCASLRQYFAPYSGSVERDLASFMYIWCRCLLILHLLIKFPQKHFRLPLASVSAVVPSHQHIQFCDQDLESAVPQALLTQPHQTYQAGQNCQNKSLDSNQFTPDADSLYLYKNNDRIQGWGVFVIAIQILYYLDSSIAILWSKAYKDLAQAQQWIPEMVALGIAQK
ncbi:hypothetical protein SS50377_27133 [Spironucleus salmonicida]|uniref:Uncharacterized protein n=1 Tax=Spironucleus salmonicida TaxID=348837 RepID=V6LSJ2_9EUKA|nr:hypothetical protein SS50377_27133 [Spironucleus salmonicida]|eukprot:EST43739.1 Hypothetical protein SS50377_16471 [Spironucleus salmonicida]